MEAFLSALALAALSGVTFIAYKHPSGYRKISTKLFIAIVALIWGLMIWNASSEITFVSVKKYIDEEQLEEAEAIAFSIGYIKYWVYAILGILAIYIVILDFLPNILGIDDDPKGGKKE